MVVGVPALMVVTGPGVVGVPTMVVVTGPGVVGGPAMVVVGGADEVVGGPAMVVVGGGVVVGGAQAGELALALTCWRAALSCLIIQVILLPSNTTENTS